MTRLGRCGGLLSVVGYSARWDKLCGGWVTKCARVQVLGRGHKRPNGTVLPDDAGARWRATAPTPVGLLVLGVRAVPVPLACTNGSSGCPNPCNPIAPLQPVSQEERDYAEQMFNPTAAALGMGGMGMPPGPMGMVGPGGMAPGQLGMPLGALPGSADAIMAAMAAANLGGGAGGAGMGSKQPIKMTNMDFGRPGREGEGSFMRAGRRGNGGARGGAAQG